MSLPALEHALPRSDNVHSLSGASNLPSADSDEGYGRWLLWLQKLLLPGALLLYRCDQKNDSSRLTLLASWPAHKKSSTAIEKLAVRCARGGSVVRASNGSATEHSVVCVPDTASRGSLNTRYVLAVERHKNARLDVKTQVKLVSWAFDALGRYATTLTDPALEGQLVPWSLEQLDGKSSLSQTLAQMMQQLVASTDSERCTIVKLVMRKDQVAGSRLLAVSDQPRIDSRLSKPHAIAQAIEKTFCGKSAPLSSHYESRVAPHAYAPSESGESPGTCCRLTLPVSVARQWFAVSIERRRDKPFSNAERTYLSRDIHTTLQVLLASDPDRLGIVAAFKRRLYDSRLWFRESLPRSLMFCTVSAAILLFLLLPAEYRVTAPLSVEAAERHVLIAPVDGFVKSVSVRAGDVVEKSQTLASLDDLDLQLQLQQRHSELMQNQQAYGKALATRDRVEVTQLKEEALLIETEISQLELQQDRLVLKAPVAGVVLSGSLDDFLGAAVSTGDTLFSIGSNTSHRLVLSVSEYDVGRVQTGQAVGIRLSADPSTVLAATVTSIMPLATVTNGVNSIEVHATLDHDALLRPGMEGLGKVLVGRQVRLVQWLQRAGARLVWLGWKLGLIR